VKAEADGRRDQRVLHADAGAGTGTTKRTSSLTIESVSEPHLLGMNVPCDAQRIKARYTLEKK